MGINAYTDAELAECGLTREQYNKHVERGKQWMTVVRAANKLKEAMKQCGEFDFVTVTAKEIRTYKHTGWHSLSEGAISIPKETDVI